MKKIDLEIKNKSAWILFHDPKELNTMGQEYFDQLGAIVKKIQADDSLRCVVLATTAKNFSVGLDLKEIATKTPDELYKVAITADIFRRIGELQIPTLALYRGYTVGGALEMTVACDFRYAQPDTKISIPGVKIGIFNPAMLTYHLPRLIGLTRATTMLFEGEMIDAQKALDWGLINKICDEATMVKEGEEWCLRMQSFDSLALKSTKRLLRNAFDMPYKEFESLEKREIAACFRRNEPLELAKNFWK